MQSLLNQELSTNTNTWKGSLFIDENGIELHCILFIALKLQKSLPRDSLAHQLHVAHSKKDHKCVFRFLDTFLTELVYAETIVDKVCGCVCVNYRWPRISQTIYQILISCAVKYLETRHNRTMLMDCMWSGNDTVNKGHLGYNDPENTQ